MDLEILLFEENVGGLDLFLRAVIGTVIVFAFLLGWVPAEAEIVTALIGAIALFSSITRHCTPYSLIGFSTAEK